MFRPRIIPVLLIDQGQLVKTKQFSDPIYVGDPINTCKLFSEMEVDELIVLDISARKQGKYIDPNLVKSLSEETRMPFAVGGGINQMEQIETLLQAGSEKVVLSTSALEQPSFLKEACSNFGSSTISVCVDVSQINDRWHILTHSGKQRHSIDLIDSLQQLEELGAGEIILQNIDRDGTMEGYDEMLLNLAFSRIRVPLVALGGCNSINQPKQLYQNPGITAFGIGRFFQFFQQAVLIHYERPSF